jgi:hypothetical protein
MWINRTENDFNGIDVYSNLFEHISSIDFDFREVGTFVDKSTSFCVTNNLIASLCTRIQNGREVFQVNFCDLYMNKLNTILLGECNNGIEIRTNGKDRFFITTGRHRLYIVSSNGIKNTISLKYNGGCIAILDNRRIAISKERHDMELVAY